MCRDRDRYRNARERERYVERKGQIEIETVLPEIDIEIF